jgi:hypothetical protein
MEVNPARAATGASMSAANTAAFVNMLRVFTIHGTSIGDIISNFSAADEMDGRVPGVDADETVVVVDLVERYHPPGLGELFVHGSIAAFPFCLASWNWNGVVLT